MLSVLGWIVCGLVIGLVARAIVPGRQNLGFLMTVALGVAGAFIGGLVSQAIWPGWVNEPDVNRMWPGWLMSVAGAVLLVGERGVESRDLALLLWPGGTEAQQRSSLHSAISGLRAVLDDRDGGVLEAAAGRYYLHLSLANIWWDWAERRLLIQRGADGAALAGAPDDTAGFLEGFFDLIPSPPDLPDALQRQWESLYEWLHELAEARAAEVSAWVLLES